MTANLRDIITTLYESNNLTAIVSLAESLRDSRDRAELQNQSYLHQIKRLSEGFKNITEPATGQPINRPVSSTASRGSEPQKEKTSKAASPKSTDIMELE